MVAFYFIKNRKILYNPLYPRIGRKRLCLIYALYSALHTPKTAKEVVNLKSIHPLKPSLVPVKNKSWTMLNQITLLSFTIILLNNMSLIKQIGGILKDNGRAIKGSISITTVTWPCRLSVPWRVSWLSWRPGWQRQMRTRCAAAERPWPRWRAGSRSSRWNLAVFR